jgi:hypothetical protein
VGSVWALLPTQPQPQWLLSTKMTAMTPRTRRYHCHPATATPHATLPLPLPRTNEIGNAVKVAKHTVKLVPGKLNFLLKNIILMGKWMGEKKNGGKMDGKMDGKCVKSMENVGKKCWNFDGKCEKNR